MWKTFARFNAKRVDFLVVDARWQPVAVVEYQGSGHFQGDSEKRDAIKRSYCRAANIAFIEVPEGGLEPAQRAALLKAMGCRHSVAAE